MEAADCGRWVGELRGQLLDQRAGAVAAAQEQAREQPAVPAQKSRRLTDSDPRRDAKELRARNRPGNPDVDGEPDAAGSDGSDPPRDHTGVEAELADDVRREGLLFEHHLNRGLIADEGVALRVAGDPNLFRALPELGHRHEQRRRAVELPCRQVRVAGDREDVADADREEPLEDVLQMLLVPDEASCEVRRNLEPGRRELLAQSQRRFEPPCRRRGDRHLDLSRDVREHVVGDPLDREHLVAGTPQ
jgi:hypothetical protein